MKAILLLVMIGVGGAGVGLRALDGSPQDVNDYPNMKLFGADGSVRQARALPPKSILILYFPDCEHCQREAKAVSDHIQAFKNYQLWFIATATHKEIELFSKQYQLAGYRNVHFVRTEATDVLQNFGAIPTPSLFIYSAEKKLVKAFKGETNIEDILKQL
jgi:peroxiredoxin